MRNKIKKVTRVIFRVALYFFALIGFGFSLVFLAMQFHLTDVKGSIDSRNSFFNGVKNTQTRIDISKTEKRDWQNTDEWATLKNGLLKDEELINRVSRETNVPARLIISAVVSEQFRFFTSNRESFKKYFEPLKVLGTYTKFSYGISGIKMDTAKEIENNLKDARSPFYLGNEFKDILDYDNNENIDDKRLARFTDSHDHYYSYLYTAIYLKELMTEWNKEGYSIDNRPEVLATLFNLGFSKSAPKKDPEVGGSVIKVGGKDYTFGGLAYEFYYSDELSQNFPISVE